MAVAVESVMRRVQRAVRSGLIEAETPDGQIDEALTRGIIDEGEAARLRAADAARYDAISVDDFPTRAFDRSSAGHAAPDTTRGRISA